MKPHPVYSSKYSLSMWHHCHYSVSSHPLYWEHHTHSLYDITIGICIASFALWESLHPHFMKSNHHFYDITPTIFYIVSMLFLSPHPLYWWYHTNSIYEISSSTYADVISLYCIQQPIHYVCTITATVPVSHTHTFHDITPFVYMTLYV